MVVLLLGPLENRNYHFFRQITKPNNILLAHALNHYKIYHARYPIHSLHYKSTSHIRWISPTINWYTLNTDGVSLRNPGPNGIGYFTWNYTGQVITEGNEYIEETTYNDAEILAIIKGIQLAKQYDNQSLIIRSYSNIIIQAISTGEIKDHLLLIKTNICTQRCNTLHSFKLQKIYREANQAADWLGKHTAKSTILDNQTTSFHLDLNTICKYDRIGVTFPRLCKI